VYPHILADRSFCAPGQRSLTSGGLGRLSSFLASLNSAEIGKFLLATLPTALRSELNRLAGRAGASHVSFVDGFPARDCCCVSGFGVAGFDAPGRGAFDAEAEEFGDDGGG
jgi:hypothetical protein